MTLFSRRLLPLLALLCLLGLLTACVAPGATSQSGATSKTGTTATSPATASQPTTTTTAPASASSIDKCPQELVQVPGCMTPQALRLAYGVQSLLDKGFTGKGQTVIDLVSFGSPTIQQDMKVFDQQFGLPAADVQVVSPLNVPEYDPQHDKGGWAGETTLDVQIIHAIAPEAKIVVLVSPVAETEGTIGLPEFRQLQQYIIDHKLGNIVSQSWGASELTLEDTQGQQEMQKWNDLLQKATTQQGITFFSSSGDHGATDFADLQSRHLGSVPTTSFAADSPWVTSVGGTTLVRSGSNFSESVWNDRTDGASGGGFSRFYSMPDYQKTLPAAAQLQFQNRRGVPDVSAVADPNTGLAFYEGGAWSLAGGTSASAPLWAGLMAIADQMAGRSLGFINPTLYKLAGSSTYAQDFHDVTVGNNTNRAAKVDGYNATTGWDAATGLGTPDAEHLIPDLIAAMKS
jgi:subtilase family serine protease